MDLPTQQHPTGQTLFPHHLRPKVGTPHILHQNGQDIALLCIDCHFQGVIEVSDPLELPVYQHLRPVAQALEAELRIPVIPVEHRPIGDVTVADAVFLHRSRHVAVDRRRKSVQIGKQPCAAGQGDFPVGFLLPVLRDRRQLLPGGFPDHFPHGLILLGHIAALGQKGIVIIARYIRRKLFVVVCPAGKAEVGAADEHIDVEAAFFEHIPDDSGIDLRIGGVVLFIAPCVEPSVPHLHAYLGAIGEQLIVDLEVFLHPAPEIQRGQASFHRPVQEAVLTAPVGGKERHIDPSAAVPVPQIGKVLPVVAVVAVFVLALQEDHRPSVGAEERTHPP